MGVGDGLDDGQAKAKAEPAPVAGPVGAQPLEWLQQLADGCRQHDGPGVGHHEHRDTVITSLPVLECLTGETGQVGTAVVTVASLTDLAVTTSAIERALGPEASVTGNLADASQAIGDLDSVKAIALYSLAGAAGAAAVILFLVMVMIAREHKREIGILKAIGASNRRIMAQFTTEAATFTLLGLVVGATAGTVAGSAVTSALVSHSGASSAAGGAGRPGAR